MESVRKRADLLGRIKWLGLLLGIMMYYLTVGAFGDIVSTFLGCAAAVGFYLICDNERKSVVARHISDQLDEVLRKIGQRENVFEIKSTGTGMVIRIYYIGAGEKAALCTKAVLEAISKSWYRSRVWVTQIVDLERREEIPEAQRALNEELLSDLKNGRE